MPNKPRSLWGLYQYLLSWLVRWQHKGYFHYRPHNLRGFSFPDLLDGLTTPATDLVSGLGVSNWNTAQRDGEGRVPVTSVFRVLWLQKGTAKGRTGGLSASTKRERIRDYMYRQIDQGARWRSYGKDWKCVLGQSPMTCETDRCKMFIDGKKRRRKLPNCCVIHGRRNRI